jgi:predicted enzyme related to lactoylglutathione lyase
MDLPNGSGRVAFVVDPTGGFVGLYQAGAHIGSSLVNETGTLVWNELVVREPQAVFPFYGAVFGWAVTPMEGPNPYFLLQVDGRTVAGCLPMGDNFPDGVPTHWMPYFASDDVDATAARASELGGSVFMSPMDIPVGRFALLNDPGGALFSVITFPEGSVDDPNAWPS